eukprot:TRINITY_DN10068_c0_g1_i3.p1 TRINITY_DN10068_c0_g1~~TRINITY_DN10068_c0_g1_i3.p1  ORF type:complete len:414 (+),score=184.42 TRINITY_DN10068_c0_g1_i3:153-1394(+)
MCRSTALTALACLLLLGTVTQAQDATLEDDEVVIVEDIVEESRSSSFEAGSGGDSATGSSRKPSGRGREKYDKRRNAQKGDTTAERPDAYSKFTDAELRKPEQRKLVLQESETVLDQTLEATDAHGEDYLDGEFAGKLAARLSTVMKPFRAHYAMKHKAGDDTEQVERLQKKFLTCQERFRDEVDRHQHMMGSSLRLLSPNAKGSTQKLRLYIRKRLNAHANDGVLIPGMVVNLGNIGKRLASSENMTEMKRVQKSERHRRMLGLVREELMWFFAIALAPFLLQLLVKTVMVFALNAADSIPAADLAVALLPPFFSFFRTGTWVGFQHLSDNNLMCLGALSLIGSCFLAATTSVIDGALTGLAQRRRLASRTKGQSLRKHIGKKGGKPAPKAGGAPQQPGSSTSSESGDGKEE